MKRRWRFVTAIVIGAAAFIWLVKVPILSDYISDKLRVPVSFVWISIWPSETTLRDFKIRNPEGFKAPYALKVKKAKLSYALKHLISDPITFDEIFLDTVFVEVVFPKPGNLANNWTALSDHMPKSKGSHAVFVNQLVLENITIVVKDFSYPGEVSTHYFDRLAFDNINSAKGFPSEQMIRTIFGGVNLGDFIKDAFNPEDLIRDVLDPVRIF